MAYSSTELEHAALIRSDEVPSPYVSSKNVAWLCVRACTRVCDMGGRVVGVEIEGVHVCMFFFLFFFHFYADTFKQHGHH